MQRYGCRNRGVAPQGYMKVIYALLKEYPYQALRASASFLDSSLSR